MQASLQTTVDERATDKFWTYMKGRHMQGPDLTSLYLANTGHSEVMGQRQEGMVWWWGEGKTYFEVLARTLLGEVSCWDNTPSKWVKLSWVTRCIP